MRASCEGLSEIDTLTDILQQNYSITDYFNSTVLRF